jgi:hypothetical protein
VVTLGQIVYDNIGSNILLVYKGTWNSSIVAMKLLKGNDMYDLFMEARISE